MYPDILFVNGDADNLPHHLVQQAVAAYQRKLVHDFAPVAGVMARLHYVKDKSLQPGEWGIVFDPRSEDQYLGEHHLEDVPRGVVLLGACKKYGEDPFEVGSHELDELLGDPLATMSVEIAHDGTEEAYEFCDAVQGTPYFIDGVKVANFVYPLGYFSEMGTRYDHMRALTAPHSRTAGGYRLIKRPGQPWEQDTGELVPAHKQLGNVTRWHRRGQRAERRTAALSK